MPDPSYLSVRELIGKMRIIEEHTYDNPKNGRKVKKYLKKIDPYDIVEKADEIIERCVLCPTEYLDENGDVAFEGVRVCTRELIDLFDELTNHGVDKELMVNLHTVAERAKWKVNKKLFYEYQDQK